MLIGIWVDTRRRNAELNSNQRIQTKIGTIFQIADLYLLGKIQIEEAKEQIYNEMVDIRPVQFEAFKNELGKRIIKVNDDEETKKLLSLFANDLPFPYKKIKEGNPLRNYCEENNRVRRHLIEIDEMEGKDESFDVWMDLYESLSKYKIHIQRLKKNFYPLMIPLGMSRHVQNAEKLGERIIDNITKNQKLLNDGDILNFLLNQRQLIMNFMDYLKLEEKVLLLKASELMTNEDLLGLRNQDDLEGYAYIEKPIYFVPKENQNIFLKKDPMDAQVDMDKNKNYGLLLWALLEAKKINLIYFGLSGELLYSVGEEIEESDRYLSEKTKQLLLRERKEQRRSMVQRGNKSYLITHCLVKDHQGKPQGFLMIKEEQHDLEDIKKTVDSNQNIAELFDLYPKFKEDFFNLDKELVGLKGPMGMELLKESTIEMLAKSLGIDTKVFMDQINELIERY